MLAAIQLDCQSLFVTIEIQNVAINRMLSAKFAVGQTTIAQ